MIIDQARAHLGLHASLRTGTAAVCASVTLALLMLLTVGCRSKSFEDYLAMGDQAMHDSKLADAETDYQSAVQLAPNDPRTHAALGNLYLSEQKSGPAQLEFMRVLDLDPRNAAAHAALANLYVGQSQYGMAEGQARAAVALDPSRVNYHLDLASALIKENKQGDAEAEIRTAIGLDPKNAQAHLALANLLASEPGHQSEAQAEYGQAQALDPRLALPTTAVAPTPATSALASAPAAGPKIKVVDKKFLLTHDSPVYEKPDSSSRVVGRVHRKGFVRVTGITGNWLRVKLRSGVVGFIPVSTAE